jgi:hypothetical protein
MGSSPAPFSSRKEIMKEIHHHMFGSIYAAEDSDQEMPKGSVVLGRNGAFQTSSSKLFEYIAPAKVIPGGFKEIDTGIDVVKRIPWDVFWQAPIWLRKQWDKHCAKSKSKHAQKEFLMLLFHNDDDGYFWYPPIQRGTSASLDYATIDDPKVQELLTTSACVGTIHNHFGRGTAFQSGTDHKDEMSHGMPMIHLTMAYMDAPTIWQSEFDIRFVCGDFQQELDLHDVVESPDMIVPEEWDSRLKIEMPKAKSISSFSSGPWTRSSGFGFDWDWGKYEDDEPELTGSLVSIDLLDDTDDVVVYPGNYDEFAEIQTEFPNVDKIAGSESLFGAATTAQVAYAELAELTKSFDVLRAASRNDFCDAFFRVRKAMKSIADRLDQFMNAQEEAIGRD